tara:strand:+ start:66 stop:3662 length:3597 start_codon:yes stop_codon:yes gene_type:complete
MSGISKRIFGSEIPKNVRKKLEIRQSLSRAPNPGDSLDVGENSEIYKNSFNGQADLSSRTPFARIWTAVQLSSLEEVDGSDEDSKEIEESPIAREIYIIGNNHYNQSTIRPNQERENYPSQINSEYTKSEKEIIPKELESNNNEFLQPPAGIKSINSQTEGIGVIKKTTVNFKVYNFHDFENIYHRYFLRPGAVIFIDFGWDIANLYDPEKLINESQDDVDSFLFGEEGVVTLSDGDMETLIGNVVNFTSKVQDDGSIDCSIEVISTNTSLISHNLGKESEQSLREKMVLGLNFTIIKYVLEHPSYQQYKTLFETADIRNYESLTNWTKAANMFAKQFMGDEQQFEINPKYSNFPDQTSVVFGVHWQHHENEDVGSNSRSLYISWGLFEDLILNREFGNGDNTFEDVLIGENSVRYDSSNSYIRYDENLINRQKAMVDKTALSYLYPDAWIDSYSVLAKKTPVFPKDLEEMESQLASVELQLKDGYKTEIVSMTDEQHLECIEQWEDQEFNISEQIQWLNENGYEPIAACKEYMRECNQSTSNDPFFCINELMPYYLEPLGISSCEKEIYMNQINWKVVYDESVQQNTLEVHGYIPGYDYSYIPELHGTEPQVTIHTPNKVGLEVGKTYNCGQIEQEIETDNSQHGFWLDIALKRIPLREVFISVSVIKKAFVSNDRLSDVINEILDTISSDSYNIFDLAVSSNDYAGKQVSVIDKNYINMINSVTNIDTLFQFEVNSPNTIAKSFDIEYSIPSDDYGSMLAIQSLSGKSSIFPVDDIIDSHLSSKLVNEGVDIKNYRINYLPKFGGEYKGNRLVDSSMIDQKASKSGLSNSDFTFSSETSKMLEELHKKTGNSALVTVPGYSGLYEKVKDYGQNVAVGGGGEDPGFFKEAWNFVVGSDENVSDSSVKLNKNFGDLASSDADWHGLKAKSDFFTQESSTPLPVDVNLTIYGISSLIVGDLFKINYLPNRYTKLTYFQCMGITHNIDNNGWTTQLNTKMRLRYDTIKFGVDKNTSGLYHKPKFGVTIDPHGFKSRWPKLMYLHGYLDRMKNLVPVGDVPSNVLENSTFIYMNSFTWGDGQSILNYQHQLRIPYTVADNWVTKWLFDAKIGSGVDSTLVMGVPQKLGNGLVTLTTDVTLKGASYTSNIEVKLEENEEYYIYHNGIDFIVLPISLSKTELDYALKLFPSDSYNKKVAESNN